MSSEEEDDDELIAILILLGLSQVEAITFLSGLTVDEKISLSEIKDDKSLKTIEDKRKEINQNKNQKTTPDKTPSTIPEKTIDGFANALTLAGFSGVVAKGIVDALGNDEEVVRLTMAGQTPLIYMTKQDSKVDDTICLPKQGEIWGKEDSRRPIIPTSLHPHCRCYWQDPVTGNNLGQF